MPLLNYENVGALTEYEYLQGTITSINSEDDTADVSGVCGSLSNVPIFYHCSDSATQRSNGALEGSSAAFSEGDVVIVLKGIDASDSLGEKYYVIGRYEGVKKCEQELIMFAVERSGSEYFIKQYKVNAVKETIEFTKEIVVDDDCEVNTSKSIGVIGASGDLNSLILVCTTKYLNGASLYGSEWTNALLRLPVVAGSGNCFDIHEIGIGSTRSAVISKGGLISDDSFGYISFYQDGIYYTNKEAYSTNGWAITSNPGLNLFSLLEHAVTGSDVYPYFDNITAIASGYRGCIAKDKLVVPFYSHTYAYSGNPANYDPGNITSTDSFIGEMDSGVSGNLFYDTNDSSLYGLFTRRIVEFDYDLLITIRTIKYIDDVIYIFYLNDLYNPVIAAYDYVTSELLRTKVFEIDGDFTRVSSAIVNGTEYLVFKTYDNNEDSLSDILFLSPETFAIDYSVEDTTGFYNSSFAVINSPSSDLMISEHNRVRTKWNEDNSPEPTDKVHWLGKSSICQSEASRHLAWLIANGRGQHEDENGITTPERCRNSGLVYTTENLLVMPTTGSLNDDILFACGENGWPLSPGHYSNMIDKYSSGMGWASGLYPSSLSQIILGPGVYNAETHSYTEEETILYIPENLRGKYRLFCCIFVQE